MRNNYFLLLLVLLGGSTLFAQQREVIIEADGVDVIKNTIEADLAAVGEETASNTIYRLRRGERYAYSSQFRPEFKLTIMATEGDGPRPRVTAVPPSEGEAPRFLRPEASDYTIMSIDIEQKDAAGQHTDNAPLRPRGQGARIVMEDCVIDGQRFEILRTDAEDLRVFLRENIFRNNFQQDNWYKNGGLYFQRGNPVDTLVMTDNVYFQTPGRMTHQINGAVIDYWNFSNNTVVNVGGMNELGVYASGTGSACFDMGITTNLIVENNIFYNMGFYGINVGFDSVMSVFQYNTNDTIPTETFRFRNNNIYTNPMLLEGTPDTAQQIRLLSYEMDSFIMAEFNVDDAEAWVMENNISEPLTFVNVPLQLETHMQRKAARWANPATAQTELLVFNNDVLADDLDFFYGEDTESFTAGVGGTYLGSIRYVRGIVSTDDYELGSGALEVVSNYPNPVRDHTTLRLNMAQDATVEVVVYDLSGRVAYRQIGQRVQAGEQQLTLTDIDLPAGVYPYAVIATLSDGSRVGATRRMIVQ